MNKKNINTQSGQIMVISLIVLAFVLINTLFLIGGSVLYYQNSSYALEATQALNLAEAGIDKAIVSINNTAGSYNGESEISLPPGDISINITSPTANTRTIEATGFIPSKSNPRAKRTIKIQLAKGVGVSFKYGVQVGEGGLSLGNGNTIVGSIYSNGNIVGVNGNLITGDAWVGGGTQPDADLSIGCLEINCVDYIFGKNISGENRLDIAQSFKLSTSSPIILNKVALKLKKVGSPSNVSLRILSDKNGSPDKNSVLATGTLDSNIVTQTYSMAEVSFTDSPLLQPNTTYWLLLDTSSDNSNYWVWQQDLGGSYGYGQPKRSSDWQAGNAVWTNIPGDLVMSTYIGGVHTYFDGGSNAKVNGSVHANTIKNVTIAQDAYYQALVNTTASNYHPSTADPAPKSFPISDANIAEWQTQAAANTYTGNISTCVSQLGPGKYVGNIVFDNHCEIVVVSPVWITGSFELKNGNTLTLSDTFGETSGVIIVDGIITLGNGNGVVGAGTTGNSILMMLSTYDSRQNGVSAIKVSNTGNSGFLYAHKGIIEPGNSNTYKELTAWGIKIFSSSEVNYETGLASAFFSSGPSGSYSIIKGTYQLK